MKHDRHEFHAVVIGERTTGQEGGLRWKGVRDLVRDGDVQQAVSVVAELNRSVRQGDEVQCETTVTDSSTPTTNMPM